MSWLLCWFVAWRVLVNLRYLGEWLEGRHEG